MKLSIIIPCYNEEQYIEELLISLIENISNYKFEIIVVDDCSEDSTFLRLENFNKTNNKIHLVDSLRNYELKILKVFAPEHGFRGNSDAGEKITNLEFNQAIATLNHLSRLFGDFFNDWDLMLTPTFYKKTPNVGGPITLNSDSSLDDWLDEAGKYIPSTPIANMTGIPAISVPCGIFSDNLPLGMQFFAPMGKENRLIDIARQLEESEPWGDRRPEIFVA